MNIKQQLHNQCQDFLNNRLEVIQNTISDIQVSLTSETKSSAGDKHETGRAMLQLEREKAGHQLAEIEKQKQILQKINVESKHQKVALGSVIKTTQANYFIAVSAGELVVDKTKYFAISAATPIAQLLLSKGVEDVIVFRGNEFKVVEVF
ncbi:3-oxoacyl-ACP synthase [Winogradskyella endarachnes]|uniref:3-oxoacyl-ACP synthase n=1 Tax=Winogradskyella endarachnes TaxID=2681965 RepID=A0A6L6UE16_9FLAO|nr:3-oxoacyl-ACP synthase [Winogradskyella endarachnes]MUU79172.1 3-oxoacyl-ACP synthase [Winogradskyella endarachnes]